MLLTAAGSLQLRLQSDAQRIRLGRLLFAQTAGPRLQDGFCHISQLRLGLVHQQTIEQMFPVIGVDRLI